MSLVLTELSEAGIAMAADSAISLLEGGQIKTKNRQMWKKLLRVPKINAGISYWGTIGLITTDRFDVWLEEKIAHGVYTDLRSLADYLTWELNGAAGKKLINANECAGVHVAGMHVWNDGVARPTFYHIHNGHLTTVATVQPIGLVASVNSGTLTSTSIPTGSAVRGEMDPLLIAACQAQAEVSYETVVQPREEFTVHPDFAPESMTPDEATQLLHNKYITHNGDYLRFKLVATALESANAAIANICALSAPPDTTQIGPRVGALYLQLQTVIRMYRSHKLPRIIDGPVTTLGIRLDGTYLNHDEFKRSDWLQTPPMTPRQKK